MARWAIVDDSSSHFDYPNAWSANTSTIGLRFPYGGTSHTTNSLTSFGFSFDGTAFVVYGTSIGDTFKSGGVECSVDGTSVSVNGFIASPDLSDASQWCGQTNLTDGSHSVQVVAKPLPSNVLCVDYVAILPSVGSPREEQELAIDGGDPAIEYGPGWNRTGTNTTGASLRFSFNGMTVGMYGLITSVNLGTSAINSGFYSVDGKPPQRFTWSKGSIQRLFQVSSLPLGNHSVEVIYLPQEDPSPTFQVRYFVVAGSTSQPVRKDVALPLIITFSIVGGMLLVAVVWLGLRKRSRKKSINSEPVVQPFRTPPINRTSHGCTTQEDHKLHQMHPTADNQPDSGFRARDTSIHPASSREGGLPAYSPL